MIERSTFLLGSDDMFTLNTYRRKEVYVVDTLNYLKQQDIVVTHRARVILVHAPGASALTPCWAEAP